MSWISDIPKEAWTVIGIVIGALASLPATLLAGRNQRRVEELKLADARESEREKSIHESAYKFAADFIAAANTLKSFIGDTNAASSDRKGKEQRSLAYTDLLAGYRRDAKPIMLRLMVEQICLNGLGAEVSRASAKYLARLQLLERNVEEADYKLIWFDLVENHQLADQGLVELKFLFKRIEPMLLEFLEEVGEALRMS